MSELPDKTCYQ